MNIQESINKIKELIYMSDGTKVDYIDINHMDLGGEVSVDVFIEAIETLLTAYENLKSYNKGTKEALRVAEDLEHQANKEAGDWEARCFELEAELEKEKEKNKKAIDFINERKKTVNKDMAEGTRLQVGTFMWQVDELLEILKEE